MCQRPAFVKTVTSSGKTVQAPTELVWKGGLTLARIAASHPRVSGPGGLLFGEADDACDFTACSESPAFDLPCVSRDIAEE